MKKLIIIGANEFQKRLIIKANEMGYETHVFAWEDGAIAKNDASYFYPISITEKDNILDYAKKIKPNGICSIASDLAVPTVNYIAAQLNLIGNGEECTILTTNKYLMRKQLKENDLPCPNFNLIENYHQLEDTLSYPVIVKPIDRSGSRGVSKVSNQNELIEAINKSLGVSFIKSTLVEEYIEGKEFSVEFISLEGEHKFLQITEKFTSGSPSFIERGHLSPGRISIEVKSEIIEVIEKALKVLKVENGASHSEVKVTPTGDLRIIEIASRMGGDFIGSDMVRISTGLDFTKEIIKISTGNLANLDGLECKNNNWCIVGFLFSYEDLSRFTMLKSLHPKIVLDFHVDNIFKVVTDSSSRNGYYILKIEDKETLDKVMNLLKLDLN